MSVLRLYLSLSTQDDASATSLIGILYTLNTIYICTCREVWSLDILHQSVSVNIRIVDIGTAAIDYLAQIVGRNVGSHTYSDTIATIDQEVWNAGRHNGRLLKGVVEVVNHINGILIQIVHDVLTHLAQSALGITHGSC